MDDKPYEIVKRHPGGAPSSYRPEYAQQLIDFFDHEYLTVIFEEKFYDSDAKEVGALKQRTPEIIKNRLPTFDSFAWLIGVHPNKLVHWVRATDGNGKPAHPEFLVAYARARTKQRDILIQNGLNGVYNPAFAMMLLKANHGMAEASDPDVLMTAVLDSSASAIETKSPLKEDEPKRIDSPRLQKLQELKAKCA